ncbi:MAG: dicarboxylate/amino acid:cation symporter [Fimbriimonadaceae bacterium]|nr:dicarboxylate/amino acid:cation symporter [Fimbriimonadaceae bacterium]
MAAAKKKIPLPTLIFSGLIGGVIAGAIAQLTMPGGNANESLTWFNSNVATPIGDIFLALIFMVVVPLLFSALVNGVAEIGEAASVGRTGMRALFLTVVLSGIAVAIGLAGVNLVRPGDRLSEAERTTLISSIDKDAALKKADVKAETDEPPVLGIIPKNPLKEANRALSGGLLPFMFFAMVFGLALAKIEPERAAPLKNFVESLFLVSQKMIEFAMGFAPIGVFFLVFKAASTLGGTAIQSFATYVILVLGCLALHFFVTYPITLMLVAKRNPWQFLRQLREVILTAFSTSSSNATLPVALRVAEKEVGLPRRISNFVLTVGATANQNGTALFEGITILFLAQFAGVNLDLTQQMTVMGLAIVAGIGTAGVPGGAWPMIGVILAKFGIPVELIGLVLGIDRVLDMSRTVLNVVGDVTIAACVSGMEGEPVAIPEMVD